MSTSDAPLMLSVSGLRGLIGRSLTPVIATRYAAALGKWMTQQQRQPHVVLGRDSRPSGQWLELAVASGLIASGCRVTSLGIATTPGVAVMIGHLHAHGGIVVTASHNPLPWNGIKALRHDGVAPPADQAARIIDDFHHDAASYAGPTDLPCLSHDPTAVQVHVHRVLQQVDVDAIRRRKLKVVVDSVCGAGGPEAVALLDALGVERVHLGAEPTGLFPHPPEPIAENLTGLTDAVREHHADAGFAQDPDADRLAIVDDTGRYIGEEYTLALAVHHVLRHRLPTGTTTPIVVAHLSTSRMIEDIAAAVGGRVLRSPVGEANVAQVMQRSNAIVGGEGNGGVILPPVVGVRDSLVAMALTLDLLAREGKPLHEIIRAIPAYAIVKRKFDVSDAIKQRLEPAMCNHYQGQRIDTQDGVRVDWPDRWVHVRPSNTEPILRIIAEARDETAAEQLIDEARKALGV
ncbi:MAG: phosphoglucosamine mutase [Phycisphaeraceae bacterium]|nr:phosphoglucosamine mutase [Phycisphaeraceae bacterium]